MLFIKNHLSKRAALIGVCLLTVAVLSLGTASAAYYAGLGQSQQQPKPTLPKQVTLVDQGKRIAVAPAELGWQLDSERITAATQHKGLPITGSGTSFFTKHTVPAYTKVNQATLTQKVTAIADATQQAPVDAKIITQNSDYLVSPAVAGQRVDVAKAVKMIKSALAIRKTTITLPLAPIAPAVTEASLQPQLAQLKSQKAAAIAAAAVAAKPVTPRSCADNPAGRQLILVSISQQHLWACNGAAQAYDTAITSGAYLAGMATPTGTWHIYSKSRNIHLTGPGYDDFVNYWMPFYSDYGFHDSSWQTFPYGSAQYGSDGSHGCVHLPAAAMAWLYGWAPVGTTVTITS